MLRLLRHTVLQVCTIHQPSIDIFESFDELLLLKRGGETIYAGGRTSNACRTVLLGPAVLCISMPGYVLGIATLHCARGTARSCPLGWAVLLVWRPWCL